MQPSLFTLSVCLIWHTVLGAPPPVVETADMAANMKKFQEVYSLATQLMNLGGNILNNANGAGSSTSSSSSRLSSFSNDYSSSSGNGILGEVVRPQFRGVSNYEPPERASLGSFGGSSLSEYGGGPLGAGSKSQPRSIMDTLLGSFLGSSLGSGSGSSSSGAASIFQPSYEEYGEPKSRFGGTQGSNIDAIVDALSRGGAKRATPEPDSGLNAGSLISQFFGGGR
ncbi:unnamed protein product [Bursaphelenchus xylophilus]|uniref:(pine wood nematode) hypothetical protein n=1 Tax=Bursaphelenchus xylophilus TaxID=6326 RepID=A0A1I7SD76_BURXY|nr:unnamed protein product [Bursaphelenchus xylophilus]CAG9130528.1 unnamed protein product [Bursaphelenchus xylophilus]